MENNLSDDNLPDDNLLANKLLADNLLADFEKIRQLPPDGIKLLNYLINVSSYFEYYPDDLCEIFEAEKIKELLTKNASNETIEPRDLPRPPIPAFFYSISEHTAKCHISLADKNNTVRKYGDPRLIYETMPLEEYARFISALYIHQKNQNEIEDAVQNILEILNLSEPCFKQDIETPPNRQELKQWSQLVGKMYELFTVAWHCNKQVTSATAYNRKIEDGWGVLLLEKRKELYQGKDTSEPNASMYKKLIGLYLADDTKKEKSVRQVLNSILKNKKNTTEYNKYKKMTETAIGTGRPWILEERKYPYKHDSVLQGPFSCGGTIFDFDISSLDLEQTDKNDGVSMESVL